MITSYFDAYKHIKSCMAKDLNKNVDELVPWVDYDPIALDNTANRLIRELKGIDTSWAGD
jgi:calcineurin-like phosphoesterase family protein